MKTDTIFYRLFQSFPSLLFELIDQPPEQATAYQFGSVEVKQLAFRIDGVFLPVRDAVSPIYFVEVQFQPDKKFYSRFFAEIFLYLDKTELTKNWRGVVLFPSRSIDTGETEPYIELLNSQRVRRVYLDELISTPQQSIRIETVKLVIEPEKSAETKAQELINFAKQEITDDVEQRELLELIESILAYKFPNKSWKEIRKMFGLSDLKKTRTFQEAYDLALQQVYQEVLEEGKLQAVPAMSKAGMAVEQIAEALQLDVEKVRQVVDNTLSNSAKTEDSGNK